ncbi:hypothetical protein GCM10009759_04730 [Kitasatospora saccharophila]|uniref:Uncharacterized protein n=1 Tax=Kitasatospora saccharophila TaxID=407973 RepID=A0ABN2W727_9ACTN
MIGSVRTPVPAGAGGTVRPGRPAIVGRRAGRLRAEVLFLGCGVLLLPWAALLAAFPGGRPWAVLDLGEAAALCTAGVRLRRGLSPFWPAVLAGALLVLDAGCDLATASGGRELLAALLMAACAELPLAAKCWSTAFRRSSAPVSAAGRRRRPRLLRWRAAPSSPVGARPAGFPTEGVSVQNVHLTVQSVSGVVTGVPASRVYAGMSRRLRVTGDEPVHRSPGEPSRPAPGRDSSTTPAASGCGRPVRPPDRAPAAGPQVRAGHWASGRRPDRPRRVVSAAAGAAGSVRGGPGGPGARHRLAAEQRCRSGEVRSRQSHRYAAGSRRRSSAGV